MRYVAVGNRMMGLWAEVAQTTRNKVPDIVRRRADVSSAADYSTTSSTTAPRHRLLDSGSVSLRRLSTAEEAVNEKTGRFQHELKSLRPYDISDEAAQQLMAMCTAKSMWAWAESDANAVVAKAPEFERAASGRKSHAASLADLQAATRHASRRASFAGELVLSGPNERDLTASVERQGRLACIIPRSASSSVSGADCSISGSRSDTAQSGQCGAAADPSTLVPGPWIHFQVLSDAVTVPGVDAGAAVGCKAGNLPLIRDRYYDDNGSISEAASVRAADVWPLVLVGPSSAVPLPTAGTPTVAKEDEQQQQQQGMVQSASLCIENAGTVSLQFNLYKAEVEFERLGRAVGARSAHSRSFVCSESHGTLLPGCRAIINISQGRQSHLALPVSSSSSSSSSSNTTSSSSSNTTSSGGDS